MTAAAKILRGSGSNIIRLAAASFAALALPPLLTRSLSPDAYSAWVTLLQVSTYVGLLDIGLQTVVARFVAERHARTEGRGAVGVVTSAVVILIVGSVVGAAAVVVAAALVPTLFPQMPPELYAPTRVALVLIGLSSAVGLPFGPFLSAFTGLQRYGFPVALAVASKLLSAAAVIVASVAGTGIVGMAGAMAMVSVLTACAQYVGWRRLARPALHPSPVRADGATVRLLLTTGSLIALWSLGGVLVSGLDTVLVGHFDFRSAGAFAVCATIVNFLLLFLNSLFSPLLPAAAALQGDDAPSRVGSFALRSTRYSTLSIVALASLLCVFAYPMLAIWVGPDYAEVGAPLLRLLVLGQSIRQLGYTYSLVVIARGQQRPATIATMAEAVVNLTASILLAQTIGAAGVAVGTIIGGVVSLVLHVSVSMHFTRTAIPLKRSTFVLHGVVLPALTALPMLAVLPSFDAGAMIPGAPAALAVGILGTGAAMVTLGLRRSDRRLIGDLWPSALKRTRATSSAH